MLKVGDIVRIKQFEPGEYIDGLRHNSYMAEFIGQLHVVTRLECNHRCTLDAGSYTWHTSILEPVDEVYDVYTFDGRRFSKVNFNKYWREADTNEIISAYDVGLALEEKAILPYDLYNVGQKGDVINAVRFQGILRLSTEYLPMTGKIEIAQESIF